jgi:hypothetical protein
VTKYSTYRLYDVQWLSTNVDIVLSLQLQDPWLVVYFYHATFHSCQRLKALQDSQRYITPHSNEVEPPNHLRVFIPQVAKEAYPDCEVNLIFPY